MIKLGLVGKDIAHSKSKEIYESLLSCEIEYSLFDFSNEEEALSLDQIFQKVSGLSITAPYKKLYAERTTILGEVEQLGIINCIKREQGKFFSTNTDYLAISNYFQKNKNFQDHKVLILGDGSMADVTKFYLDKNQINYDQKSRKLDEGFHEFNIPDYFDSNEKKLLVINSCSREYTYRGETCANVTFWDYNYSHKNHKDLLVESRFQYVDGIDLLRDQAIEALKFWGINY